MPADDSRLSRPFWRRSAAGLAAVLALAVSVPANAQPMGIPSMGSASAVELSPSLEKTLGDAIMEQGRRDPTYIADPDVSQYLTDIGRRLAAQAPGGVQQTITVFAVRDPQINAFALPGGYIGVHSGLVVAAQSESELASVIAHEIGHVSQRHIARGMTQQSQSSGIMMAALAGALLAALSGSPDLAMGVASFGQAAAVDRQLGFSRQAEQEADRSGFEMMRKAGFDPAGMARMFQRLATSSRLNEGTGGGDYTSTHPLSIQRLSDIENRIREAPTRPHADTPSFWYIQAKLRVLQARDAGSRQAALDKLRIETQRESGVKAAAAWYGLAYAAWQKQDSAAASQALARAQDAGQDAPELSTLAIALASDRGDAQQALKTAQAARAKWPRNQSVALALAEALQKTGQHAQAIDALKQDLKQWPDVPRFNQLLAQSYERSDRPIDARRSMAAYYVQIGALPTAVEQLQQARGLSKDFYVQSQLDVQIRDLKQRLESDRELLKRFKKS